jgi:hypothetical protein
MGRVADCGKHEATPLGHPEAGLPGGIPRMDAIGVSPCICAEALTANRERATSRTEESWTAQTGSQARSAREKLLTAGSAPRRNAGQRPPDALQ